MMAEARDTTTQATSGLANVAYRSHASAVEKVTSSDGTRIAYERTGEGPPVVIVGGGLNAKWTFGVLAELLSERFTVFNYDRRGRGDSGDGDPDIYTADLEVDDLKAVLGAVGEKCSVFANCTGGMIAIRAAGCGVPMTKLALYEPPYSAEGERPPVPDGYLDRLRALLAEDRKSDAVALFEMESVGMSEEFLVRFMQNPIWPMFEALAPTLLYDSILGFIDDGAVPFDLLPKIDIPVLVLDGGDSPVWQRNSCEALARGFPQGRHVRFEGQSHIMNKQLVAPVLAEFFAS